MPAAEPACEPRKDLFEVRHVSKSFPGVRALDEVSILLKRGTVHALVGENGAGKSTLMRIIAGICTPDAGELRLEGKPVRCGSPREALACGIAMIHQELNLMPFMSVAENIWIGREPLNALGLVRHGELRRRTRALLERLRTDIDPDAQLRTLPIAARQMVEIARALSHEPKLLIMDEPTSALTGREAEHLFAVIRTLTARGTGVFYITHRMEELFAIADEISVLRDGRHIATGRAGDFTREALIHMMVGRELPGLFPVLQPARSEVALSARCLTREGEFHDVSFDLHAGEILGIAGLVGSGRSELAAALFGLAPADAGTILIGERAARIGSPSAAMAQGLALLTEDRKETGCLPGLSVLENLEISVLSRDFVRFGFVRSHAARRACARVLSELRVRTRGLEEPIGNLSGGNQQKVLLGRWLLTLPKVLILDEPTRGIDVGAKAEIHQLIASLAAHGTAVLLISSEMPEVLGMSHRIMVMHEGRLTGILDRS
ncbi:MAG TPA: sugar ABC transporter ATP-binding protein, partial [Steroidobacteraceae bacterium]|nr:sugar ABC transporter ATP-binding protein [Steroidobacteraceae bacterium]